MNTDDKIMGGTWLFTITTWAVENQPTLTALSTCGALVLTVFGVANYVMKWRKGKY